VLNRLFHDHDGDIVAWLPGRGEGMDILEDLPAETCGREVSTACDQIAKSFFGIILPVPVPRLRNSVREQDGGVARLEADSPGFESRAGEHAQGEARRAEGLKLAGSPDHAQPVGVDGDEIVIVAACLKSFSILRRSASVFSFSRPKRT